MVAYATKMERMGFLLDSFMKYIARVTRCSNCYRDRVLSESGLTGTQCPYLVRICRKPGISQDQLAGMLYVSKSNVTRQLERMEQAGLVTRSPLPTDRRVMQVFPTEAALALMPKLLKVFSDWNEILTKGFTTEEQQVLLSMLERLYANAEDAVSLEPSPNRRKGDRP